MIEISRRNGPLIASALLSVLDWNLLSSDVRFAGLDSYEAILTSVDFRMAAWNIHLWGQLVLENRFKKTLTTGIATFADLEGPLMAISLLSIVPVLVIFLAAQRFIVDALAPGFDER